MSFSDQLFKAGLLSKKELREGNTKSKKNRKKKQGERRKKTLIRREDKQQKELSRLASLEGLKKEREHRSLVLNEKEREHQVDQILTHHRLKFHPRDVPFWHVGADRRQLHKMLVTENIATALSKGELAISFRGDLNANEPEYVIVPSEIMPKIIDLAPHRLLFPFEH